MLEKIQKLPIYQLARQLRDVRMVGFLVFGFLVLLVSYSGVNVIQTNFELQKQVAKLQQENTVSELENTNLKLRNQYYDTDEYRELVARKQYGKALPGETLLLIPESVALQYTIPPADPAVPSQTASAGHKPTHQTNLEAWRSFLLNKSYQL